MTGAPDRETQGDKQPEATPQVASGRVPVLAMSLAALAIVGAATANSFPNFALPDFNQFLPSVDRFALPDFSRFSPPNLNRVAAPLPPAPAPVLVPDPVLRAGLRDIQSSQQEHADVLQSLTQSAATQQADMKSIKRQLFLLTAQVNSLQNRVVTEPQTTSSIPRPNSRARIVQASRRVIAPVIAPVVTSVVPPLPRPVGPVSVGGAPLSPPPVPGSGDG